MNYRDLCHSGITRLLRFVRTKNLSFSTTDVRQVVSNSKTCAEVKLRYYRIGSAALINAIRPIERINLDFKGPLPLTSGNSYLLIAIDEYSRFPFAFPCKDMMTATVIRCLDKLFTLWGTAEIVHSDNGPAIVSGDFKKYLLQRGIASKFQWYLSSGWKWAGRENCWHCMESSAASFEKTRIASIALGSCFGGCAAFCAVDIMHCYKHYPS